MTDSSGWATRVRATVAGWLPGSARWSDALRLGGAGLALRLLAVIWGARRFPPAADGTFYDTVARRIAEGEGYTWLWPDGAVTYAAHYPVGYPAIVGALYAVFGPTPAVAMVFNALLGALAVVATYWLGAEFAARRWACAAALIAAVHPSLVLYTPAIMTEGVTAALYVIAAWGACHWARKAGLGWGWLLGLVLGATLLVRPQSLLLVPVVGAVAAYRECGLERARGSGRVTSTFWFRAAMLTSVALLVCAPWTLRNCQRMGRCVLVSANGGWNLLIGTAEQAKGAWIALTDMGVPVECREVFEEALKDACFGEAAVRRIRERPAVWLGLAPRKWGATFDYPAAPAHYLRMSNPTLFSHDDEQRLVAVETVFSRVLWALSLLGFLWLPGPARRLRGVLTALGLVSLASPFAWAAVLCLLALGAIQWRILARARPLAVALGALALTALIHAVFFGAGRYALVGGYLAGLLAIAGCAARSEPRTSALNARTGAEATAGAK